MGGYNDVMRRTALALVLLALASSGGAAMRRRGEPAPASWLASHATTLESTELVASTRDLEPLRPLVANSTIVALGDVTHGTHEVFTLKLRLIDFLVRELGFDTLAIEAPFTLTSDIDAYIHGGSGDARALLRRAGELDYTFWNTEEFLAMVEWLRAYNLSRPANEQLTIAGFDIYDEETAQTRVVEYVRRLDPAAATAIAGLYRSGSAEVAYLQLAARRADLEPHGASEFANALQLANIARQRARGIGESRDAAMAENALWIRAHRGRGKMLLWAHQEHLGRTPTYLGWPSMGQYLASQHPDYFAIGHLAGGGSFLQSIWNPRTNTMRNEPRSFRQPSAESYEAAFREAGLPRLLVSLHGALPSWLEGPASYRSAGSSPNPEPDWERSEALPQKFDAVIFLDATSPARELP